MTGVVNEPATHLNGLEDRTMRSGTALIISHCIRQRTCNVCVVVAKFHMQRAFRGSRVTSVEVGAWAFGSDVKSAGYAWTISTPCQASRCHFGATVAVRSLRFARERESIPAVVVPANNVQRL